MTMNPIPRISTRGYYDLSTGSTLKNNLYFTYPKNEFKKLIDSKELTIMIHGLRNDNAGAIAKVLLAKKQQKTRIWRGRHAYSHFWRMYSLWRW